MAAISSFHLPLLSDPHPWPRAASNPTTSWSAKVKIKTPPHQIRNGKNQPESLGEAAHGVGVGLPILLSLEKKGDGGVRGAALSLILPWRWYPS